MSEKIVEYIGVTQAALTKAASELALTREAASAARGKVAAVAAKLASHGLIKKAQASRAEAAMATHAGTLDLLDMLAERAELRKQAQAPDPIGTLTKSASSGAEPDGERSPMSSPADRAFVENILKLRQSSR